MPQDPASQKNQRTILAEEQMALIKPGINSAWKIVYSFQRRNMLVLCLFGFFFVLQDSKLIFRILTCLQKKKIFL